MKTIFMVLASERFRYIEYLLPKAFFEQPGWKVQATLSSRISVRRFGYEVKNNFIISEVLATDFQGINMVGGAGALKYLKYREAKKLFETFLE